MGLDGFLEYIKIKKNNIDKIFLCHYVADIEVLEKEWCYTPSKTPNEFIKIEEFFDKDQEIKDKVYNLDQFINSGYEYVIIFLKSEMGSKYNIAEYIVIKDKKFSSVLVYVGDSNRLSELSNLSSFAQGNLRGMYDNWYIAALF